MPLKVAVTVFVPLAAVSTLLPLPRSISAMVPTDVYKGFAGASVYPPEEQDQQEFPSIHDVPVTVLRRLPSGRVVLSVFRCYFKRHKRLPHNHALNLKGDVLVMRVAAKNFFSVVNMRGSDREVADFVVAHLLQKLRDFQGPHRTRIRPMFVRMHMLNN
ncbi:hypothetical protein B0H11DRAFT_2239380 [Mycena galericulata]|nr:hypothetical protein B0H11DRAFT_2239380 [Mycena galericulata]